MAYLEINGYKKSFGDIEVLKGVDLSLEKGEVVSIIGSSGGGKSTLLRSINFLETPDAGTMTLDGEVLFDRWFGILLNGFCISRVAAGHVYHRSGGY